MVSQPMYTPNENVTIAPNSINKSVINIAPPRLTLTPNVKWHILQKQEQLSLVNRK